MPTPTSSAATTDGIRIAATAFYLQEESDSHHDQYVFGYRIQITNEGNVPATLTHRHWIIIDGEGRREEVHGPGVVGQTPTLAPGQSFKYTSYCPLTTPWGTMEGAYDMQRPDGTRFPAAINRFYLAIPAPTPTTHAQQA